MYFTNRLELLKKEIENSIKPGGKLHLTAYQLHSHVDFAVNIPVTKTSTLKSFFKDIRDRFNLYPFEIAEGLNHYFYYLDEIENVKVGANLRREFLHNIDGYNFSDADSFRVHYINIVNHYQLKEYQKYKDRLFVEKIYAVEKKPERKIKKTIQHLKGEILFKPNNLANQRIEYFESELNNLNSRPQITPNNEEPDLIDNSNAKATEKIIYLKELGVLDFLMGKEPFNLSTKSLANVLSSITGENSTTLQPYLNPIKNPTAGQKNNPLNNTKNVDKVKQTLIKLGFNPS